MTRLIAIIILASVVARSDGMPTMFSPTSAIIVLSGGSPSSLTVEGVSSDGQRLSLTSSLHSFTSPRGDIVAPGLNYEFSGGDTLWATSAELDGASVPLSPGVYHGGNFGANGSVVVPDEPIVSQSVLGHVEVDCFYLITEPITENSLYRLEGPLSGDAIFEFAPDFITDPNTPDAYFVKSVEYRLGETAIPEPSSLLVWSALLLLCIGVGRRAVLRSQCLASEGPSLCAG